MFAKLAVAILAASTLVSAGPHNSVHLHRRGYTKDADKLEPYDIYKARSNALHCSEKQGTSFYDLCCHPLLKTQKLSDRPEECNPWGNNDDECEDDDEPTTTSHPSTTPHTTTHKTTSTSSPPSNGGTIFKGGKATWYKQYGNAGACGHKHSDSDHICAIDIARYGSTSRVSSVCGKTVIITNTKNGKKVECLIADVCPTCSGPNSIDMSTGAFQTIATLPEGEVPISWQYKED